MYILMLRRYCKIIKYECSGCTIAQEIKNYTPPHVKNFEYIINQFSGKPFFFGGGGGGAFLRIWDTHSYWLS